MGIVIVAIVTIALSLLPFNVLVQVCIRLVVASWPCFIVVIFFISYRLMQVTMFMRVVNLLLEYFALIRLKYTEPDTPRPFVVPGGKIGAYLIVVPTMVLSGTIPPQPSPSSLSTTHIVFLFIAIIFRIAVRGR